MPEYLPGPTLDTDVVLNWTIANGTCTAATGCPCLSATAPAPIFNVALAVFRMAVCFVAE